MGGGVNFAGGAPASTIAAMLTPAYRETFVQEMKAVTEGRIWSANSICLPGGYSMRSAPKSSPSRWARSMRWLWQRLEHDPLIYTDGSPHSPKEKEFGKWHGESIGFWNGDELIVHTNQIRGWKGGLSETAMGSRPWNAIAASAIASKARSRCTIPSVRESDQRAAEFSAREETPHEDRMQFNTCTDTMGPSQNVYMDEKGQLNIRLDDDPLYWEAADTRPWAIYLNESDKSTSSPARLRPRAGR